MISNIITDPNEQKYRKIKINNQKFQKRVLETTEYNEQKKIFLKHFRDAPKILDLIGFKPKGDYFICSDFNVESLKLMKEELDKQVTKN